MVTEISWQYIAGFFDGEGCIYQATKHGRQLGHFRLTITQTEIEVLEKIKGFLEHQGIKSRLNHIDRGGNCKRCHTVVIDNIANVLPFLRSIQPYTIVKRDKTKEAILVLTNYLHLNSRDKTTIHKDKIIKMRDLGYTYKEIRDLLGISVGAIWRVAHGK